MKNRTRIIATAAMLAALQLALLYIGTLMPGWKLASAAVAGIMTAAVLIECGMLRAVLAYVVVSALSFLLLPQKTLALLYIVFFGYYPLIKSVTEHVRSRVLEWLCKLIVFNFACALSFAALRFGFVADVTLPGMPVAVIWLLLNAAFVVFDLGLSKLIALYLQRIHKNIK